MALPEKLQANYTKFQAKNDLPVFLKGGPLDRGLFGLTVALCGVGIVGIVHMVYTMGFKKKSG
ncbi:cytochrome c oxidase subunit 7A1, mitochondrial [Condylostylus longicornis]|uniref:cytochrome c oxidase subunit 7A1, mitochondrial n=1 Tax=Condylostylus longicornis TaxID=2530218 RepID=UPI00244E31FA|nr:cytochrome c oxidase subunit 7A1, mitochondrial [Condylostylus longicornis]XP_055376018.1 cytochrome c oxidase subunit 7A1, mitochondrial [Condylostylus longicornis]XP_055376019.1 cytochrome c oxidase subunit 7A1, mitochondrial [Condylostylus longicornis]